MSKNKKTVPKMRSRLAVHSATLTHFATGDRWRLFLLSIQDTLSESVSVIGLDPFCSSVVAGVPYSTSTGMKSGRVAFPSSICLHGGVAVTAPGIFESITTSDIFAHLKKAAIVGTHHVELFFEAARFNAIEQRIADNGPTGILDPGAEAFSGIMDSV